MMRRVLVLVLAVTSVVRVDTPGDVPSNVPVRKQAIGTPIANLVESCLVGILN